MESDREAKLEQLLAITATMPEDRHGRSSMEEILRDNDWDVERTVNVLFSSDPSAPAPRPRSETHPDRLASSASSRPRSRGRQRAPATAPIVARVGMGTIYAIFWPIRMVLRLVVGIWYFLIRNLFPASLLRVLPRSILPAGPGGSSSGFGTLPLETLPESLRLLTGKDPSDLPAFFDGTYKPFLRHVKDEGKIGLAILVSGLHEDDAEFKRNVLTDPDLLKCLREHDVVVWGADIREREGYQVSQTLQATTYPSLTFFSLMPMGSSLSNPNVPTSSSSMNNAKLTIVSSISGPPSSTTSATAVIQHITNAIVPRVRPFLARRKREMLLREEERKLRLEQDRALRESERRDTERIRRRRDEETQKKAAAEAAEREAREQINRKERRAKTRAQREVWRRQLANKHLPEASADEVKTGAAIRINVKLPNRPGRNVRAFPAQHGDVRDVYLWVETLLASGPSPAADVTLDGYRNPYEAQASHPLGDAIEHDQLKLFTAYPRKFVAVDSGIEGWQTIVENGASLVAEVEMLTDEEDESGEED